MVMEGRSSYDADLLETVRGLDLTIANASAELANLEDESPESNLVVALRGSIADASLERAATMVRMVFGGVEVVGDVSSGTVPPAPVNGAEPDSGDLEEDYPGNVTLDGVPLAHSTLFEDADASG